MKTIFAIGAAAAALMAASSAASAQDCAGGWKMIKDQIPVRCESGALPSVFSGRPLPDEPMYTGSINATDPGASGGNADDLVSGGQSVSLSPDAAGVVPTDAGAVSDQAGIAGGVQQQQFVFASGRDECQPGQYYMLELESGNRPVACQ